jgi:hypothetical protein
MFATEKPRKYIETQDVAGSTAGEYRALARPLHHDTVWSLTFLPAGVVMISAGV